jgi:hypothetical protein
MSPVSDAFGFGQVAPQHLRPVIAAELADLVPRCAGSQADRLEKSRLHRVGRDLLAFLDGGESRPSSPSASRRS